MQQVLCQERLDENWKEITGCDNAVTFWDTTSDSAVRLLEHHHDKMPDL